MFRGKIIASLLLIRAFHNEMLISLLFVLQSIAIDIDAYIPMPYVHTELLWKEYLEKEIF